MPGGWITTAALAAALLAQTLPAAAQWGSRYGAQTCRTVRGRFVCSYAYGSRGAAGGHAYERWSDGSAASGSGSSLDTYRFPQYLGGRDLWYGFGR
jgi:hypothetical protein